MTDRLQRPVVADDPPHVDDFLSDCEEDVAFQGAADADELRASISGLEQQIESKSTQLKSQEEELGRLRAEASRPLHCNDCGHLRVQIDDLNSRLNESTNEVRGLKERESRQLRERSHDKETMLQTEARLRELREELERKNSELEVAQTASAQLQSKNGELGSLTVTVSNVQTQLRARNAEYEAAKAVANAQLQSKDEQISSLDAAFLDASRRLEQKNTELDATNALLQGKDDECSNANRSLSGAQEWIEKLRQEQEQTEARLTEAQKALVEQQRQWEGVVRNAELQFESLHQQYESELGAVMRDAREFSCASRNELMSYIQSYQRDRYILFVEYPAPTGELSMSMWEGTEEEAKAKLEDAWKRLKRSDIVIETHRSQGIFLKATEKYREYIWHAWRQAGQHILRVSVRSGRKRKNTADGPQEKSRRLAGPGTAPRRILAPKSVSKSLQVTRYEADRDLPRPDEVASRIADTTMTFDFSFPLNRSLFSREQAMPSSPPRGVQTVLTDAMEEDESEL